MEYFEVIHTQADGTERKRIRKVEQKWTLEQDRLLVKMVSKRQSIWDSHSELYRDRHRRYCDWKEVADATEHSMDDARNHWNTIKSRFNCEWRRMLLSKRGDTYNYKPKYPMFQQLTFLQSVYNPSPKKTLAWIQKRTCKETNTVAEEADDESTKHYELQKPIQQYEPLKQIKLYAPQKQIKLYAPQKQIKQDPVSCHSENSHDGYTSSSSMALCCETVQPEPENGNVSEPENGNVFEPENGHCSEPENGHCSEPDNGHCSEPEPDSPEKFYTLNTVKTEAAGQPPEREASPELIITLPQQRPRDEKWKSVFSEYIYCELERYDYANAQRLKKEILTVCLNFEPQ